MDQGETPFVNLYTGWTVPQGCTGLDIVDVESVSPDAFYEYEGSIFLEKIHSSHNLCSSYSAY